MYTKCKKAKASELLSFNKKCSWNQMNWLENFGGSIDLETKIKYKECIGGFDQDLEHSISKMIKVITKAEKKLMFKGLTLTTN